MNSCPNTKQLSIFGVIEDGPDLDNDPGGTYCERSIVELFRSVADTKTHKEIRERLSAMRNEKGEQQHADSTISRAITRLTTHGVLVRINGKLSYTGNKLPPASVISKPGKAAHRMQKRAETPAEIKREVTLVNAVLIEQLERVFEAPNTPLSNIIKLIMECQEMAWAVQSKDRHKQEEVAKRFLMLAKKVTGRDSRIWESHLLSAIQLGLFPDEFMEDEESRKRLEADNQAFHERTRKFNDALEEDRYRAEEHLECVLDLKGQERKSKAAGKRLKQLTSLASVFTHPDRDIEGLVPPTGLGRIGQVRLELYADWMGGKLGRDIKEQLHIKSD